METRNTSNLSAAMIKRSREQLRMTIRSVYFCAIVIAISNENNPIVSQNKSKKPNFQTNKLALSQATVKKFIIPANSRTLLLPSNSNKFLGI